MIKKSSYIIAILVLTFIIFAGLSFPGCSNNDEAATETTEEAVVLPQEPLVIADATTMDATITANYESAETMAKQWKSDAQLYLVSIKLPVDLSLNAATQTYTYGSASLPNDWWTYSLSETTGKYVRALIPKEDYLGDVTKPIDKNYWRTNYVEAFQIAEANGGSTFRAAATNVSIILTLSQGEPNGWLWWLVEYKTSTGDSLEVRINPNDKTIVDETGTIITSQGTYSATESVDSTTGETTESLEYDSTSDEESTTVPTSTGTTYPSY